MGLPLCVGLPAPYVWGSRLVMWVLGLNAASYNCVSSALNHRVTSLALDSVQTEVGWFCPLIDVGPSPPAGHSLLVLFLKQMPPYKLVIVRWDHISTWAN